MLCELWQTGDKSIDLQLTVNHRPLVTDEAVTTILSQDLVALCNETALRLHRHIRDDLIHQWTKSFALDLQACHSDFASVEYKHKQNKKKDTANTEPDLFCAKHTSFVFPENQFHESLHQLGLYNKRLYHNN